MDYKMSAKGRKDMSMGTHDYDDGYEKGKRMSNDRYGNPAMGKVMGHDRTPGKMDTMPMNMYKKTSMPNRGYDSKAYDYKY